MSARGRLLLAIVLALIALTSLQVRTQDGPRALRRERFAGREVAAREVLVRFRPSGARVGLDAVLDLADDQPLPGGWRRLASRSRDVASLVASLSQQNDVLEVEPNYVLEAVGTPNDPSLPSLWGLRNSLSLGADIHAVPAWDITTGTPDVVVGVVDGGIDYTHPDLAPNMWSAPAPFTVTVAGVPVTCAAGTHGFNALAFEQWLQAGAPSSGPLAAAVCEPLDQNGHGTHVAGSIGAAGNNGTGVVGVNWTTRMMALKFMGTGNTGTVFDAIAAIDFAIQAKAAFAATRGADVRVLSNSYGADDYSGAFLAAVQRASAADMLFVAAAGNQGRNNDATPFYPASFEAANVVSVAATNSVDDRAGFSNFGAVSVDLGAPGDAILSTTRGGSYGYMSGTSMATPHVSGAALLVLAGCELATSALRDTLLGTVDLTPAMNGITATGGRLNVDRALRSCASIPSVILTSPLDGAVYGAPAAVLIGATASDDHGISKVEFFADEVLIGTSSAAPFGFTWNDVPAGHYVITAKAYSHSGITATSGAAHMTVTSPAATASAAFAGLDATTQGAWRGVYGTQGYQVVGDVSSYPAYATVTVMNAATWTWANPTTDVRALQRASGGSRVAATWYHNIETFTLDINVTDGAWHQIALYAVDWEGGGRVQRMDVRDAATNLLLESRSAATFGGGQYWRWNVRGHVKIAVTRIAGPSSVVSGLFLDPAAGSNPGPSVRLTGPLDGTTAVAPAAFSLTASATDADGVSRVEFFADSTLIATASSSPYRALWNDVPPGSYTLTAKAYDTLGAATTSDPVHVTVTPAPTTAAFFIAADGTTKGTWRGAYGGDGYHVVADAASLPPYAVVQLSDASTWTWSSTTSDSRALQRSAGNERIAAAWYRNVGAFTIDIDLTDAQTHHIALYMVDWEAAGRTQTVELRDAASGALLDVRTVTGFVGGQFWRWAVRGHVRVVVNRTASASAVVSGLFFDTPDGNIAPAVSLTSPVSGTVKVAPASFTLAAAAEDLDGIDRVEFYADSTLIGSDNLAPYSVPWNNVAAGGYVLTAKAVDTRGASTVSAPVQVTVAPSGAHGGATFVGADTATRGTWRGHYGVDGYAIPADTVSYPVYAQVAITNASIWTWANPTTDVRGLQRSAGTARHASTWYRNSGALTIDVSFTDGQSHEVALYLVDWETGGRSQTFEIRDASTQALLDSRTLTGFSGGQYLRWTLRGHVTVTVTKTTGPSTVIGGLFFGTPPDGDPSGDAAAVFVGTDSTTRGSWRGVFGNAGYYLAGDTASAPSYASATVVDATTWTWTSSTTDVRALQRADGSGRSAGAWYRNDGPFVIDIVLSDGNTHDMAFYVVDWENGGRSQTLEIRDASSNRLLDVRTMASFSGGQYWRWRIRGSVRVIVQKTAAASAVISGVLFE